MATVIDQVNELADLQGRSAAILTLARRNAEVRADIGRKTVEITAQINRVGEALRAAQVVAARVVGANDKQTEHLNNLEAALNQAPTAEELNVQVDVLSALTKGLDEGPPATPPSNLSAVATPLSHQPHQQADIGTAAGEIPQRGKKLQQEKEKHPLGDAERAKLAVVN